MISMAFCALLFFVGLILSHRSAGPIYAFENFLEDLMKGKYRKLKLRAGDEFTHLEEVAENITIALKKRLGEHDLLEDLEEIDRTGVRSVLSEQIEDDDEDTDPLGNEKKPS